MTHGYTPDQLVNLLLIPQLDFAAVLWDTLCNNTICDHLFVFGNWLAEIYVKNMNWSPLHLINLRQIYVRLKILRLTCVRLRILRQTLVLLRMLRRTYNVLRILKRTFALDGRRSSRLPFFVGMAENIGHELISLTEGIQYWSIIN